MTSASFGGRRWDPIVRITHWAVAAVVVVNRLIVEGGSWAHVWIGLGLAGLLLLRWVWGLVGPVEARFTAFLPSFRGVVQHLDDLRNGRLTQHRSHNPLGALMVYALWGTMAVVIASGVAMTGFPPKDHVEMASATPSSSAVGHEAEAGDGEEGEHQGEGPAEEIHELAANILLGLAVLHLAGVAFEVRRRGRQVVTAMIDGGERARDD